MSEPEKRPEAANAIDSTIAAIVRRKASRLVGRAGLRPQDRQDIEQELVIHILEQLKRFDPSRGPWPAFVQTLVGRFGKNLIRTLQAAKRKSGPLAPLPDEGLPEAEMPGTPESHDVAEAISQLPGDLQAVAELLLTRTVADAARSLGVSRDTVHERVRELRGRREMKKLLPDP